MCLSLCHHPGMHMCAICMSLSFSVLFYSVQVQNIELDIMADLITSHLFHTFSVKPFFFCMKNPFFVFIIQTMVDPFFFSQF